MRTTNFLVSREQMNNDINIICQTVKSNSFSNGQKTAVIAAATDAIDAINGMLTEVRDFIDEAYTAYPAYDDTAAINANITTQKAIMPENSIKGIQIDLSNKVAAIKKALVDGEAENIVGDSGETLNEIYERSSDYTDAYDDAIDALDALNAGLIV